MKADVASVIKTEATNGNSVDITQEIIDFVNDFTNKNGAYPLPTMVKGCYELNMFLSKIMAMEHVPEDAELKEMIGYVQDIFWGIGLIKNAMPKIE